MREALSTDVQAAFDSDPAAQSTDETVFSYPGLYAICVQRLAHELYKMDVPLLPRIMTDTRIVSRESTSIPDNSARVSSSIMAPASSSVKRPRSATTSRSIKASRWGP